MTAKVISIYRHQHNASLMLELRKLAILAINHNRRVQHCAKDLQLAMASWQNACQAAKLAHKYNSKQKYKLTKICWQRLRKAEKVAAKLRHNIRTLETYKEVFAEDRRKVKAAL